jgi:hypothetical protein
MTTLRDLLLELRAIRIGIQALIQLRGSTLDLRKLAMEPLNSMEPPVAELRKKPRDAKSILHRNDEASAARERLAEMGDDTLMMIEKIRSEFGDEAAEGMKRFYEERIVGKR